MKVITKVLAETVPDITVNKVRPGSIVYTDKFKIYNSFIFCAYTGILRSIMGNVLLKEESTKTGLKDSGAMLRKDSLNNTASPHNSPLCIL